jgi:hypothetical protein
VETHRHFLNSTLKLLLNNQCANAFQYQLVIFSNLLDFPWE